MDEALDVLREALGRAQSGKQMGADVRLALKTLRFCGVPQPEIKYFWESCQSENELGRWQGMNAALNRILLFRTGKLPSK